MPCKKGTELKPRTDKNCEHCGENMRLPPHRLNKRFCSSKCQLNWLHNNKESRKKTSNTLKRKIQNKEISNPYENIKRFSKTKEYRKIMNKRCWKNKKRIEKLKTPEFKMKMRKQSENLWKNSQYREKIRTGVKKVWLNPMYREATLKKIFEGRKIKPNKAEIKLDNLLQQKFPNEWKYVGDGYTWIVGKNPDFLNINGQKKLIELFGDYWHSEKLIGLTKQQAESLRVNHFAKYGFKTLIVWEHELKNPNQVTNKIKQFQGDKIVS